MIGNIRDSGWGAGNNIGDIVALSIDSKQLPGGIRRIRPTIAGFEIEFLRPVDLQAAFIGDDDLLSHLRRLLSAPAAEVEIHLLPLLLPLPEENRNQLARRAQHCVSDCLERLRAPNAEPQASALTS